MWLVKLQRLYKAETKASMVTAIAIAVTGAMGKGEGTENVKAIGQVC